MSNDFEMLWKDTLLLQFHDILPGSSVPEVYDDCYDIWIDNIEKLIESINVIGVISNVGLW